MFFFPEATPFLFQLHLPTANYDFNLKVGKKLLSVMFKFNMISA